MHMSHHIVSAVTSDRIREAESARRIARRVDDQAAPTRRRPASLRTLVARVALSDLR